MNVLTFSTLFPNAAQPVHGVFVEQRLLKVRASGTIRSTVVAPVPWFPSQHQAFGKYADFARVPQQERRNGIQILHPRYLTLPKVGMTLAPVLLASATAPLIRHLAKAGGGIDLIDAHYLYPDGVAATLLGRWLGIPTVVTARGSDVNVIADHRLPNRWIRWAAAQADGLVVVSEALGRRLEEIGVSRPDVEVIRNGVDLEAFRPLSDCRESTGARRKTLMSIGNLVENKGHHIAIDALRTMPDVDLIIVGAGTAKQSLQQQTDAAGLASRVRFEGPVAHQDLPRYYNAVDAVVLASAREGMPNVLLESIACGTPVIATRVGGIPEIVRCDAAGVLMDERSAHGLVDAAGRLFARPPSREETRRFATRFSWDSTAASLLDLFRRIVETRRASNA